MIAIDILIGTQMLTRRAQPFVNGVHQFTGSASIAVGGRRAGLPVDGPHYDDLQTPIDLNANDPLRSRRSSNQLLF